MADIAHSPVQSNIEQPALKRFLKGEWLGHPLHPVLTDIPVGAWTAAMVLDAAVVPGHDGGNVNDGYAHATNTVITVGLAGALGAAVTGLADWSDTEGDGRRMGMIHGVVNVTATTLFACSLAARRGGDSTAGRRYSTIGYLIALVGAYIGGSLVFREEVGVDPDGPSERAQKSRR